MRPLAHVALDPQYVADRRRDQERAAGPYGARRRRRDVPWQQRLETCTRLVERELEARRADARAASRAVEPWSAEIEVHDGLVTAADARFNNARRNAARIKPLFDVKAASQKDYDDATSAEEIAAADLKAARARLAEARLNLGYTTIW